MFVPILLNALLFVHLPNHIWFQPAEIHVRLIKRNYLMYMYVNLILFKYVEKVQSKPQLPLYCEVLACKFGVDFINLVIN